MGNDSLRIAVVNDDEKALRELKHQCEELGHRVITYTDGQVFLNAMGPPGTEIDIVLLDLNMPNLDGLDTIKIACW